MSKYEEPLTFENLGKAFKQGQRRADAAIRGATAAPDALFGLLLLAASMTASWGTPFIRRRIGLAAVVVQQLPALLAFSLVVEAFDEGTFTRRIVEYWWIAMQVAYFGHLFAALWRLVSPGRVHVHRFDIGEPAVFMRCLWSRLMGRWATNPLRIALLGEPLLFLAIAAAAWIADAINAYASGAPRTGLHWLPLLTAIGIFMQAAFIALRDLRQLSLLSDQETEQTVLAESLMKRPHDPSHRDVEGVVDVNV